MDDLENIDEMVDEIIGDIDAGSRPPREYKLACSRCGDVFTARTEGAKFCPSCRQIMRREAGRKGAEKAHGLRAQTPAGGTSSVSGAAADTFPRGEGRNAPVTREALLEMACRIVSGDRDRQYGSPEDSFWAIAHYWTVYLQQVGNLPEHRELTAEDTAIMMILLKVARQAGRGKLDNWVDIAGYAACGAEITAEVDDG